VGEIEALGRRSVFIRADVADPRECERLIDEAVDALGRLDIFCSNAGVARWQELADVTPDAFEHIVAVNLHGCFFGCRAAAAQMRRQGDGGRIIVTSSINAVMPFRRLGIYGATKHAVAHLVAVMAREWAADRITVNHVGPGWVDSHINDPSPDFATEELRAAARASIPLEHRATEPGEIGEAVAYFASARAAHTTGAFLRVDGGLVIGKY
jgi:NAD(P)-dependent dehydrogenase (short-subunit alcohol dehydrogenase family)